jgi:CheY-like chemotaxis protein
VAVSPVTHAVQAAYESRCNDRGLKLSVDCPNNIAVWGDPALLDRVLRNLVDNAVKFTQHGGVNLTCQARDHQVAIMVADTGAGIEPDDLSQIYDPFYRGRSAREAEVEGLGLGLAITAHMVHLMGGNITIDSARGVGTTVRLNFARAAMAPSAQVPVVAQRRKMLRYARIVLLEDDRLAREATLMWLIEYGAQVISASDVNRALTDCRARKFTPDFILADFRLGVGENGIESIKRLRAELGHCPAAIVTGEEVPYTLLPDDVKMLRKPLKPEQLEDLLG